MNEGQKDSFQISQGYNVITPSPGKAYPILCSEWNYLKEKIRQITDRINIYHTIGSVLIGAAVSTFIVIVSGGIQTTGQGGNTGVIVSWACVAVTGICGGVCVFFAYEKRKVTEVKCSDVIAHMEVIEQRFDTAFVEPNAAPNGGPATQLGNSEVTAGPPSVS